MNKLCTKRYFCTVHHIADEEHFDTPELAHCDTAGGEQICTPAFEQFGTFVWEYFDTLAYKIKFLMSFLL